MTAGRRHARRSSFATPAPARSAPRSHYLTLIALVQTRRRGAGRRVDAGRRSRGALVNYALNHRFTFASRRAHAQALPRFAAVAAAGIVLNALVLAALLAVLAAHYLVAQVVATLAVLVFGFLANRRMDVLTAPPTPRPRDGGAARAVGRRARVQRGGGAARVPPAPVRRARQRCRADAEIVYVNDGSRDGTIALLLELHDADPRVAVVDLSRNFGKEIAMSAGLDHARGDAVIVIDADLQDPPELIPELVAAWQEGFDVVLCGAESRADESWLKQRHRARVLPRDRTPRRRSTSRRTSATSGCCRAARSTRCARCPSAAAS